MEEGSFRCDANVSIRPVGESKFGTKVEVKNMNRISAVGHALRYEIERQIGLLENSEEVQQETRSWEDDSQTTITQRKKESLNDYMYFPEPDLPQVRVSDEWIEAVRSKIPPSTGRTQSTAQEGVGTFGLRCQLAGSGREHPAVLPGGGRTRQRGR